MSFCKDHVDGFQNGTVIDDENSFATPQSTPEIHAKDIHITPESTPETDAKEQATDSSGLSRKTIKQRCNEFISDFCSNQLCQRPSSLTARYVYGFIFLLTNLFAWIVRDYGHKFLSELDHFKGCRGGHDCLGSEGALRVSMGCFVFFAIMFLTTVGTTNVDDPRSSWHSEWWSVKIIIWITLTVTLFLVPSAFIQFYGEIARFGAGIFLIIQLISVKNFVTWWNDFWLSDGKAAQSRLFVITMATATYTTILTVIILMYSWYAPEASCHLNIFFITWTLILIQVITCISLHPKVNAGAMTSGLMSLYIVYLCWSALRSEPQTEKCNTRPESTGRGDWMTILGFIIAMITVVMSTFSAGIDSKSFQFKNGNIEERKNDDIEEKEDVPYGYGFFHFIFSMGAMYFGMLFIGWNLHQTMQKWSIDVGWTSTWVKIVNEWLAVGLYVWTLVAPLVWKNNPTEQQTPNT